MSLARCEECEHIVDTDDEPEAYVPVGTGSPLAYTIHRCLCSACRNTLPVDEDGWPYIPQ